MLCLGNSIFHISYFYIHYYDAKLIILSTIVVTFVICSLTQFIYIRLKFLLELFSFGNKFLSLHKLLINNDDADNKKELDIYLGCCIGSYRRIFVLAICRM